MQIEVEVHHKYGKPRFMPLSDDSRFLLELLDKKSFSAKHLHLCKQFGWDIEIKAPKYDLEKFIG
jgi:hypothetical protein